MKYEDQLAESLQKLRTKFHALNASHARLLAELVTIREISQPEDYSEHGLRYWLATCHTIADTAIKEAKEI